MTTYEKGLFKLTKAEFRVLSVLDGDDTVHEYPMEPKSRRVQHRGMAVSRAVLDNLYRRGFIFMKIVKYLEGKTLPLERVWAITELGSHVFDVVDARKPYGPEQHRQDLG